MSVSTNDYLAPASTTTGSFAVQSPVRVASNHHLNVDEAFSARNTTDTLTSLGTSTVNAIEQHNLASMAGESADYITRIKLSYYISGAPITITPGAKFEVFVNGAAIVPATSVQIEDLFHAKQIVWENTDLLTTLTVADWNAASSRTMKITTINGGALSPGSDYTQD